MPCTRCAPARPIGCATVLVPTPVSRAFVAEDFSGVIGMATCSERAVTGWNGPVIFLQDLFVEPHCRRHGVASALMARVAALARDVGSPIVELTVRADNPAQNFYLRTGFQPLPHCLTFVLAGPALAALADQDSETCAHGYRFAAAKRVNPSAAARPSAE